MTGATRSVFYQNGKRFQTSGAAEGLDPMSVEERGDESMGGRQIGMENMRCTHTLRVDLDSVVVEDIAVALAADGALVESHDILREG